MKQHKYDDLLSLFMLIVAVGMAIVSLVLWSATFLIGTLILVLGGRMTLGTTIVVGDLPAMTLL